jgi:hypothetical protein
MEGKKHEREGHEFTRATKRRNAAAAAAEVSREAAKECSPRRKPWVTDQRINKRKNENYLA